MLAESGLSTQFCYHDVNLYNGTGSYALHGKTLNKVHCGSKPDVSSFRVLGCQALIPRGQIHVLLASGRRMVKHYNMKTKPAMESKHVAVDETVPRRQ